jgi:hypothetical protein
MAFIGNQPNINSSLPVAFGANAQAITASYTFPVGQNAQSLGVITHSAGVVTINANTVWQVN